MNRLYSTILWLIWMLCPIWVIAETTDCPIVFVHVGPTLPHHLQDSVAQARLFNENSPIYIVASQAALNNISSKILLQEPILIPYENLSLSPEHLSFSKLIVNREFWVVTIERFLFLYDLIAQYDLKNIVHLENDNMLYADLAELLPVFKEFYPGIAATFDSDQRCIAGFIYIANKDVMQKLAGYFAAVYNSNCSDMQLLAKFKDEMGSPCISHLPIIPESYALSHPLVSANGRTAKNPALFFNHIEQFNSIFDAAAIGQYLGGGDIYLHAWAKPGFINESCIFNPSFFKYEWIADEKGRYVPFSIYNQEKYRINNLHIHSKELFKFTSTSKH